LDRKRKAAANLGSQRMSIVEVSDLKRKEKYLVEVCFWPIQSLFQHALVYVQGKLFLLDMRHVPSRRDETWQALDKSGCWSDWTSSWVACCRICRFFNLL
jgi:hypothetical protein